MKNETYLRRQRHILLDMHIPDWDERFLSRFDPEQYVDLCVSAGADAVMVYCNSHAGQCYWPTKSGRMHAGLDGRDIVGETVESLQRRGIAVCAYYSVFMNNWAYTEHPDWRLVPSASGGVFGPGSRYGVCCPNHPEFLEFMLRQTEELAASYSFDAFFYDIVMWPDVCVCDSCRQRYRREEDANMPTAVNWFSSAWCRFQAARERWLANVFAQLRDRVKESLDIPVFHNSGVIHLDWVAGVSPELLALNDIVGGDFLVPGAFHTMAHLSPTVIQYMHATTNAVGGGISQLMSTEEQKQHALAATTFGGQFMAIDTVEPDGNVSRAAYARLSEVFAAMRPYESYLGGKPVADVAVYWSHQSNVSFGENGVGLDRIKMEYERIGLEPETRNPHSKAAQGALKSLGEEHLPVGAITRDHLDNLDQFRVIVLPNVLRMDSGEAEAFRRYVELGGRLYASGYTSLVSVDGTRHEDFLLSDVLGCHFVGEETAAVTYLKPVTSDLAASIAPVRYAHHGQVQPLWSRPASPLTALRVSARSSAQPLATTTLPYGEGRGTRDDQAWANTLATPPWDDTSHPAVIHHRFGKGEVVYSTADIEAADVGSSASARVLFTQLVRSLLDGPPTFAAEAHPDVWMTAFHEPDESRVRLCFLNRSSCLPALPIPRIHYRLSVPTGRRFIGVHRIPTGEPSRYSIDEDGSLRGEIHGLELFEMLAARYQ